MTTFKGAKYGRRLLCEKPLPVSNTNYVVWAQEGHTYLEQNWSEQSSEFSRLNIAGMDGFLLIIKETQIEWD